MRVKSRVEAGFVTGQEEHRRGHSRQDGDVQRPLQSDESRRVTVTEGPTA